MSGIESAKPAIKDVQTLKANLKEQEKRARSENEVEEIGQVTDQAQPQDGSAEQRKRRKVSNPDGLTTQTQEPAVLDGPLPTNSIEPIESSANDPHSNLVPTIDENKDPSLVAPLASSPAKNTKTAIKPTIPDTIVLAPLDENNDLNPQPAGGSASSEVANQSVASKEEPKKTDQEETDAKGVHPEATKAEVPTEAKETVPETIPKPVEAVTASAAST